MDKEQVENKVSVLAYNDEIKSVKLNNLQSAKLRDELTKQLDLVAIPLGQHLSRFDKNKNGIIDLYENEDTKYIIEDLPSMKETKYMIGHIEDYLVMKEKEISLLVDTIIKLFQIADSSISQPRSIPVLPKTDEGAKTIAFEKQMRVFATAFANATRRDDKHTNRILASEKCDSPEKKFIANSVWKEINGEYLFTDVTTEEDYQEEEQDGTIEEQN